MLTFMASLGGRRQYLLNLLSKNNNAFNDTMAVHSTVTPHTELTVNTSGELSLKLTILCFITIFGACLVDQVLIERLLHPARFYNLDPFDAAGTFTTMMTSSLGCSTFQVLTHCFHVFRLRGLFDPKNKTTRGRTAQASRSFGSMLGTAFYPAHYAKYRTFSRGDISSVGNGFWIRVLELIPYSKAHSKFGYELLESNCLKLRAISNYDKKQPSPMACVVSERGKNYKKYFEDIAFSEAPALMFIVYFGFSKVHSGFLAFTLALLYPIAVKLIFAFLAVDRKTFHVLNAESANDTDVFETQFGASRLSSIEGEHALVHRFFEYYGQPIRDVFAERVLMMALALCLGPLPFVVAYCALSTKHYAYPWLAHQAFVLIGWYIARLMGLNSCGRTEERIAKTLYKGKKAIFVNADGTSALEVTLQTTFVTLNPAVAPTPISAKPVVQVPEQTKDASHVAGIVTPFETSSAEIVEAETNSAAAAQGTPLASPAGSINGDEDLTLMPQTPSSVTTGLKSPTTPSSRLAPIPKGDIESIGVPKNPAIVHEEAETITSEEPRKLIQNDQVLVHVNRKSSRGSRCYKGFS
jgi:hypothetical protein